MKNSVSIHKKRDGGVTIRATGKTAQALFLMMKLENSFYQSGPKRDNKRDKKKGEKSQ